MKNKEKPCKGIGKAKGVKGCGKITMWRKYGLCSSCYADFILNTDYGRTLLQKATITAIKPRMEMEKLREEKQKRDKLTTHLKTTQKVVHEYVRKRDEGKPCISCGTQWHKDFQAGHYFKAELYTSLKFDLDNIHGQCIECNIRLDGNLNPYGINLPKRIGLDAFNRLKFRASQDKLQVKKWTREELSEIRKKIKQLK